MNGIVEITVKKKKHILRYNLLGCFEFETRCNANPSGNHAKICMDLVYSGVYGDSMKSGLSVPDYKNVSDLFDDFTEEKDYSDQMDKIWKCFNESSWGKKFMDGVAAESKKKEEEKVSH